MKKYKTINLVIMACMVVGLLAACESAKKPQIPQKENKPQKVEESKKPEIPEQISQGQGKEPILKVYMADTKEIKEMPMEEYIYGVLAGEMQSKFPDQALGAQAILARTFVMEFITEKGESKYEGAHISTDIEEAQAWNAEGIDDKIKAAVDKTRGMVLLSDGKYVKAWFHAHAGGKTAAAKEGLGYEDEEPAYIQVIDSPDYSKAPQEDVNWTVTFTKGDIQKAAKDVGKAIGDFSGIDIAKKGPSGRATEFKIGDQVIPAPAFRIALDSTKMKSTLIKSIKVQGDKVTMEGLGYGHGVGMSQWGAYGMAEIGSTAEEIVNHYFKDVEIVKLF